MTCFVLGVTASAVDRTILDQTVITAYFELAATILTACHHDVAQLQ
jgi:hypothetical protein